ncbi:MAG: fucose isomerase [Candidatus Cloacimonetes bacterium]|nr:fucose isomerase [Candidatus Cloacimonadota bacterium]
MIKSDFIAISSDFLNERELQKILLANQTKLKKFCQDQIDEADILNAAKVCYFIATGGTEAQVIALQKQRDRIFTHEEVTLLAYESNNSLAASLELLARFQQLGNSGRIIYLPESDAIIEENDKIRNLAIKDVLSGYRIGQIGKPSDWLVASSPSAKTVKDYWGADLIDIELADLKQLYSQISQTECANASAALTSSSQKIIEPSEQDITNNVKVYLAMKKLIQRYSLDAVTLRCFDLVLDLGTTGCFALSRLNDEGVIAGCEGDIVSTLGMLFSYQKTGILPWMANPSSLDIKHNSLILAHCTVPISMVKNYTLRSHFESGIGIGIQGKIPSNEVTIFRIGGNKLDKIWQAKGKLSSDPLQEDLCRTQVKITLDPDRKVGELLTNPLGNHLIVLPGYQGDLTAT